MVRAQQIVREGSIGLNEISTAINQMDGVTRKNAAMVEEDNAAIDSLAVETDALQPQEQGDVPYPLLQRGLAIFANRATTV